MYAELHCKTNFTFLEGASHADELVGRAVDLGYAALAVTDRETLSGVVRAHIAAKERQFKLIYGAEIQLQDAPPVVLWATDRAGYGRLARLITVGRRRAAKGRSELTFHDLAQHHQGLLAGILPSSPPGILPSSPPGVADRSGNTRPPSPLSPSRQLDLHQLGALRELFGEGNCYLLAEAHQGANDAAHLDRLAELSRRSRLPLVAGGDVYYHVPQRRALQDVLTAIRHGLPLEEAGSHLFANAQRHLRTIGEIRAIYCRLPGAVHRTLEIAERCRFSLDELRYEYPEELAPAGVTPFQYLCDLTWRGARKRYPQGIPDKVRGLLNHELTLIQQLNYEAYFLTVWDLVRFARQRDILCQGRGSAANSAVCFCLGITSVDPHTTDLLFERFVSAERDEAPDIDVDFEHERREEVLQYLYQKYGRERAGLTAVVITYRARSAIRDVGKTLGLSLDCVDAIAKNVEGYSRESNLDERCRQAGLNPDSETGKRFVYLVNALIGFPRHLSQHVGGMVITQGPLCELAPIENAAMADRTVIQWDKSDLEELGILKVDCLALGMLTAIHKCFDLIAAGGGERWTLANVPKEDPHVYDMVCRADTIGVFQIESRAQMSMLPRLRPRCYYDLVVEVAIVRPGPIQGQMVHPYLRRRAGEERVTYPNQAIKEVLHKTLGVPIFQEQAMRLAVVAAGFTPGEADQLRRAMGAWRRPGLIDQFHKKLIEGMNGRGLSEQFAEQVFNQIRGFGEYGFPESHAASFALLVYVSAWLKCYHQAAFTAALINSQPMGFYAIAQLIRDARDHGVQVLPVDINASQWDCTLESDRPATPQQQHEQQPAAAPEQKPPEQKPPEQKPPEQKPPEQKPPEQKPPEQKPPEQKPPEQKPPEQKPPEQKPPNAELWHLRLGFRVISGFAVADAERILTARQEPHFRRFESAQDVQQRTRLGRATMLRLAEADAFGSLEQGRRQALWEALGQEKKPRRLPLFDGFSNDGEAGQVELPAMRIDEEVVADYQSTGLSLKAHPMSFYRSQLNELRVCAARDLETARNRCQVRVAGLVLLRQRPSTAKGITFVTLEDETGVANLLLHQKIWEQYYVIARRSSAWIAHGRLERQHRVIHVIVNRLEDLSDKLGDLRNASRDFR